MVRRTVTANPDRDRVERESGSVPITGEKNAESPNPPPIRIFPQPARNGHPGIRGGDVSALRGLGTGETADPPVRFLPLILFALIVGVAVAAD